MGVDGYRRKLVGALDLAQAVIKCQRFGGRWSAAPTPRHCHHITPTATATATATTTAISSREGGRVVVVQGMGAGVSVSGGEVIG
jgi:hypothetical protein